jgi:hypothetical protein
MECVIKPSICNCVHVCYNGIVEVLIQILDSYLSSCQEWPTFNHKWHWERRYKNLVRNLDLGIRTFNAYHMNIDQNLMIRLCVRLSALKEFKIIYVHDLMYILNWKTYWHFLMNGFNFLIGFKSVLQGQKFIIQCTKTY